MRLFDRMDPRRLDLRASLRDPRGEWLVRVTLQRVGVPVMAMVDVSASMQFGAQRSKLDISADFLEALGASAFRLGDTCGMITFGAGPEHALDDRSYLAPVLSRGAGHRMAAVVRDMNVRGKPPAPHHAAGLADAALRLSGRPSLVFVISDFHWPLDMLTTALDLLPQAFVVPVVVWDPAETTPPARDGIMVLGDAEARAHRTLWMRPGLRAAWRAAVIERRADIHAFCTARQIRPFFMQGHFDADAMSEYFLEART
jgi:uncharacterized protein (DUF58 family)